MVDIKTQKEFNLDEEVKPIVLANNMDNDIVKKINEILVNEKETLIVSDTLKKSIISFIMK